MNAAKNNAERQREFRARQAEQQTTEVRGIFAHADDHTDIKAHATTLARRRERNEKRKALLRLT